MQARYYCLWFFVLIVAQILAILVLKSYVSSEFQKLNKLDKLLHCAVSSNFPFSTRDWDFQNDGGPDEHYARMKENGFEVTVNIFINWFFNTLLLTPMVYLCKYNLKQFKAGSKQCYLLSSSLGIYALHRGRHWVETKVVLEGWVITVSRLMLAVIFFITPIL